MKAIKTVKTLISPLLSPGSWRTLANYVGMGKHKNRAMVDSRETLAEFVGSRASHVAQTSLYGYLRTRAGTRFPELFENPDILISINIAKWHIWLACVSDLSVFVGQTMYQTEEVNPDKIELLMSSTFERILEQTEIPPEAGEDIVPATEKVRQRINNYDWTLDRDDDNIFSASPSALFYWSPIADELKDRDETIVRNSVRFRWIEIRRSVRKLVDIKSLIANEFATLD